MKTLILCAALIIGGITTGHAQTTNKKATKASTSAKATKKTQTTGHNAKVSIDSVSNRVIYKSKATGQRATVTGQHATGTGGQHANNPKNAGRAVE